MRTMRSLMGPSKNLTDTFFGDFFDDIDRSWLQPTNAYNFTGGYDIEETDSHYLVTMDLPGVDKKDININLEDNVLKIHAVRGKEEHSEENERKAYGRFYGEFSKAFSLPNAVDADGIAANYENGVLNIAIPKTEASKGRKIEIEEGKGSSFWDKLLTKKADEKKVN